MAKCYRCDMCGVVTILKIPLDLNDSIYNNYDEPAMTIYTKNKNYDICANCARRILNEIERKAPNYDFVKDN